MLRPSQSFFGFSIRATDGSLGAVKDVYFDDQQCIIRYLVADMGNWLTGRLVLIATDALEQPDWNTEEFPVRLTTEEIENSPGIDTDQPLSLQKEQQLRTYFSWREYWDDKPLIQPAAKPVAPCRCQPSS